MSLVRLFLFIVGIATMIAGCSSQRTFEEFEMEFNSNRQEFDIVASQFLNQDKIVGLTVRVDDNVQCDELNAWRLCPDIKDEWEMWSVKENAFVTVPDFRSVLLNEGVKEDMYEYFSSFLKTQEIQSIRKTPGSWVEFDDEKMGLRFNSSPNASFTDGLKYVHVRQLNANWYVYEKKKE